MLDEGTNSDTLTEQNVNDGCDQATLSSNQDESQNVRGSVTACNFTLWAEVKKTKMQAAQKHLEAPTMSST
jgi:hypothetical protein